MVVLPRRTAIQVLAGSLLTASASPRSEASRSESRALPRRPRGVVRVVDHALADAGGPFLGLGVSYFTALCRCKQDRPRLHSDLAFLSRQGFGYIRMLSMVGWHPGWAGLEVAPIGFTTQDGRRIDAWPDYWQQMRDLVDIAFDRYGLRTQITVFADAQLMPGKATRIEHMRRVLADVVAGREQKIILLEVANEAWQNGFPGTEGIADLREFTRYLADRTEVPVATSSNHAYPVDDTYRDSAADIATWHFSRDRRVDDGWGPVYDPWELGGRADLPPVSSNEPIGPGASVATETSPIRLTMAAAFAFAARLPMYVFHCGAGALGRRRFEDTPGIDGYRHLVALLPPDLPNWQRSDAKDALSPLTVFANGKPNRTWPEEAGSPDGCARMAVGIRPGRFVGVPVGIRPGGLTVEARVALRLRAYDPLSGRLLASAALRLGQWTTLPTGPGGLILRGDTTAPATPR